MQDEPASSETTGKDAGAAPTGATENGLTPPCDDESPQVIAQPGAEPPPPEVAAGDDGDDNSSAKSPAPPTGGAKENKVNLVLEKSQASLLSTVSGDNNKINYGDSYYRKVINTIQGNDNQVNALSGNDNKVQIGDSFYGLLPLTDAPKNLDRFITKEPLLPPTRTYKSLDSSKLAGYTGALLSNRILLLSCYDEDVALNIAKSIAHENKVATKHLVTLEKNCQGSSNPNLNSLIDLARPHENGAQGKGRVSQTSLPAIWVWSANDICEGDLSDVILNSLLDGSARIEQYQIRLREYELCLICMISPQKIPESKHSRFEEALKNWGTDFLLPLLEDHELDRYEALAETITQQRQQGLWGEDSAEFYNQVVRDLKARDLHRIVTDKSQPGYSNQLDPQKLFNRQDPLIDTVLYCATYFPDLSPQDFSYLVELFLGDATEEVTRTIERRQIQNEKQIVDVVESAPIVRRWRRESDAILQRCKLFPLKNANNERVIDFQVDGLRSRLSQYIQNDHYYFFESNFQLLRQQGLLFSPRKKVAECARQLLVEMARQYAASEVVNWLYEIVTAFEELTRDAVDLPRERSQLFCQLPEGKVRTSRNLVCQGLSLVLTRLNKEPELAEAVRLFWQRLLQTRHQWFLDLLRRMGNFPPAETLQWLKQLLDQGSEPVRIQVCGYLVGYLLRRDAVIYATLKEVMLWPQTSQAWRRAQMLLIIYCTETNRQLAQQDYGQWPSSHPLFGFQSRAEAGECIDLLIGWLLGAAAEVHEADALFVVADIFAGWYFILSPTQPDSGLVSVVDLDAPTVRQLLLKHLAQHLSRQQKNSLLTIWEGFKNGIEEQMLEMEQVTNPIAGYLLDAELMSGAAKARRKLMDTRALLSRLRKDFVDCAAEVTHA